MSKLVTTEVAHPSSAVANLTLNADGTVDGPGVGNLVAVKHVIKTDTQTSSAVGAGANVAVTGLSITHSLANAANKLIISAYFGVASNDINRGLVGLAVADDGTLIGIGNADGSRSQVAAGGAASTDDALGVTMPSVTFVYEPGDTNAHTYTVRAINIQTGAQTLFINRSEQDTNSAFYSRGSSGLVIQEVKV